MKTGSKLGGGPCEAHHMVKTYSGHTRFATSSLASFDGTHPHQWTREYFGSAVLSAA